MSKNDTQILNTLGLEAGAFVGVGAFVGSAWINIKQQADLLCELCSPPKLRVLQPGRERGRAGDPRSVPRIDAKRHQDHPPRRLIHGLPPP